LAVISEFLREEQSYNEIGHHQDGDSEHNQRKNAHRPATSSARMRAHTATPRRRKSE
jgi:hypothetical protein